MAHHRDDDLTTDVRRAKGTAWVTVSGEIDVHSAPGLRERLGAAMTGDVDRVVVDLEQVTFLDSTGLGVLVAAHKALRAAGHGFALVCSTPRVLRIIEITGLDRVFTVHPDATAALGASGASPG